MALVERYGYGVLALYPIGSETLYQLSNHRLQRLNQEDLIIFLNELEIEKGDHLRKICSGLTNIISEAYACEDDKRLESSIPTIVLEWEERDRILHTSDRPPELELLFKEIQ